ncbi:MAG TPA: hypothetical protein VKV04_17195, partial [Verrucomicrobiae bacterium]|nr:hypothetical protein [Verrucomicrobiae bacterium]
MQLSSRKGWLACGVWIMMLCLALQSRAADATVSTGSADELQSALEDVVAAGGGTITVTAPILIGDETNGPVDVGFDGVSNVVLTASSNSLFIVSDGSSLSLSNMALINGVSTNGGAVYIFPGGTATFTNCLFSNNIALGVDGFSPGGTNDTSSTNFVPRGQKGGAGTAGLGGAIFNLGTNLLSVFNCTFATNSAFGGNGGDGADGGSGVTRGGTGGNGGAGGVALGGAIYTAGPVMMTNTTFSGNVALGGIGGTAGAGGAALIGGVSGTGGVGGS